VLYSLAAQVDNLGDIAIRNALLDWFASAPVQLHLYVAGVPASYLDAFDLPPGARLHRGALGFQTRLLGSALRGGAVLVFAPGPLHVGRRRRDALKSLVNLVNALAVRARGGAVVAYGRSLRGEGALALGLERALVGVADAFVVRDTSSGPVLGRQLRVEPDLAFHRSAPRTEPSGRGTLVLSFRGDRAPDEEGLRALVGAARELGLRPCLVTQVQRDDAQHLRLAGLLGVEVQAWGDRTHRQQLHAVLELYAGASIVVSDRLHALVFGLRSGAVPLALPTPGSDKLTSTLGHLVELHTFDLQAPDAARQVLVEALERSAAVAEQVDAARVRLDGLRADLLAVLARSSSRGGSDGRTSDR